MAEILSSYEKHLNQEAMPAGKKKVLLAALHLFASQGFSATTTAAIAKEAGVSEGTIYKYFSSKKDLLTSLLTPLLVNIRNSFFTDLQQPKSLDQLIDFALRNRIKFASDNFELIKILLQEALTSNSPSSFPAFKNLIEGDEGLFAKLNQLKNDYPEINPDLTPEQMIRIAFGPLIAYVLQTKLLNLAPTDREFDLRIIHHQIKAGLTAK